MVELRTKLVLPDQPGMASRATAFPAWAAVEAVVASPLAASCRARLAGVEAVAAEEALAERVPSEWPSVREAPAEMACPWYMVVGEEVEEHRPLEEALASAEAEGQAPRLPQR